MKKMSRKIFKKAGILGAIFVLMLLTAVNVSASGKVKLNKSKLSLVTARTYKLKVSGTKKKVTWSSSNKAVASVSKKGVVTAKKNGSAVITAKVGGKKLQCRVTVKRNLFETGFRYKSSKAWKAAKYIYQEDGKNIKAKMCYVFYDTDGVVHIKLVLKNCSDSKVDISDLWLELEDESGAVFAKGIWGIEKTIKAGKYTICGLKYRDIYGENLPVINLSKQKHIYSTILINEDADTMAEYDYLINS